MTAMAIAPRAAAGLACLLWAIAGGSSAQTPDPRAADLVQAGKVRVGLFSSQYVKDPATGELKGVRPDMARAFAARLGVAAVLIEHRSPPAVIECLKSGACDVVFLPKDARAAAVGDFSFPFIQSEFTLLVPAGSAIRSVADADKPDVRIAVVRGHASTASFVGIVKHVELMQEDGERAAFELLRSGRVDAFASTRQLLKKMSANLPGSRVLPEHYGAQLNRVVVPKGHPGWLAYANEFVEEAKASGLVQQAIDREIGSAFAVAPPGDSN